MGYSNYYARSAIMWLVAVPLIATSEYLLCVVAFPNESRLTRPWKLLLTHGYRMVHRTKPKPHSDGNPERNSDVDAGPQAS